VSKTNKTDHIVTDPLSTN